MNSKNKLYDATEYRDLREVMKNSANRFADHNAFVVKNKNKKKITYRNITYKQFDEEIDSLGTAFIKHGLKGKPIAVISKNRYEWMLTYLSTVNGVGIIVPLDKGLPEREIEFLLQRSRAEAVVFSEEYLDVMKKIRNTNNSMVTHFICMDKIEEFTWIRDLIEEGKELLKKGNTDFTLAPIDAETMSMIFFTSGTTSLSKAVMLSHKNIVSNLYALNMAEKIYDNDVNMAFLPFHHTFGSTGILLFLNNGATNVFCDRNTLYCTKFKRISSFRICMCTTFARSYV